MRRKALSSLAALPLWLCGGWLLLQLGGCATYSTGFAPIEQNLAAQDPASAMQILEKQRHPRGDLLLYFLNKAMLQRMQHEYAASNQTFEQAKQIIQTYAAVSVTEESAAFIFNDTTRTYTGTPLEQVMLHVYAALNYLELGEVDAARVEALQVEIRLRQLMQDSPKSALSVDPFARFLSGMIYEDLGEYSDAMIAYRKAYEAYQAHAELYALSVPEYLKRDLLRMARKVGLANEYQQLQAQFGITLTEDHNPATERGEIVLLFHNGLAPVKREHSVAAIDPASGRLIRVSLPFYQGRPELIIAQQTLETYMPAITARAVARAVLKYNMAREAGNQNDVAGLLVNIMGVITEQADTRSWLTLPANIQMARLPLPSGSYTLSIELLDTLGQIQHTTNLTNVKVNPGERRYISYHYVPRYMMRK
jgi:tetratricopeptide (TPR) repeat protein